MALQDSIKIPACDNAGGIVLERKIYREMTRMMTLIMTVMVMVMALAISPLQ